MSTRLETGACFCGAVAAEMHGDPFWICYDHDDDCRRAIGSRLTIWIGYRPNEFRLTRGVLKSFSKTKGVTRTFCPECGTSISYFDEGLRDELYLTIGFFDHPERFPPQEIVLTHNLTPRKCLGFLTPLLGAEYSEKRR